MKTIEIAKQAVQSGITPVRLAYYATSSFAGGEKILRSVLVLESLEMGVLTPTQYRFVARRTKQGEALVERHLDKLLSRLKDLLLADRNILCVTVPVFPRVLVSGKLSSLLFNAIAKYPGVDPKRICVELSADILFEDFSVVRSQIAALRELGVKIAISEVGDDYCPLTRLAILEPDYVFADEVQWQQLQLEQSAPEKLARYLHISNTKVFLPSVSETWQQDAGRKAGFDGCLLAEPVEYAAVEVDA